MALSVGRMRCGGYEYLYLPSPLLTKEGKGGAGIVNKLLNTYKDDRKGGGVCGVSAPHDEILLFRQKDPKPLAPRRGPTGAFAPVPNVWAAELASLKQSSPPTRFRDWGAATPAGALRWRHVMARVGM